MNHLYANALPFGMAHLYDKDIQVYSYLGSQIDCFAGLSRWDWGLLGWGWKRA